MDRTRPTANQDLSTNDTAARGKQLLAVASLFLVRSVVWFAFDYHWPRHPDKFWVFASFGASMILGAMGILQWRSATHKLRVMDVVIAFTCAMVLVWGLFAIYP